MANSVAFLSPVFPKSFIQLGLSDKYSAIVGGQQYLRKEYDMDADSIVNSILTKLNKSFQIGIYGSGIYMMITPETSLSTLISSR